MNVFAIAIYKAWKRFTGWPKAAVAEIMFMAINNLFFLFVWYLVVQSRAIPGWGMDEALLFLGGSALGFALAVFFAGNVINLEKIVDGSFDMYFLRPKSILLQYASDHEQISEMGDAVFGLILLYFCRYPLWAKLFVTMSAALIFVASGVAVSGLFMVLRAINTRAFAEIHELGFTMAVWPSHALKDRSLRFIFTFIIPGFLYVTLPIEVLRGEIPIWPLLFGYAVWVIAPAALWKEGLKRYTGVSGIGWMGE